MDQDLERWLFLLIWCNTTTQIAVEKGTSSMQASQGLRISIKDCCNFERISGLAFSIFTGDQTFLQWTNKRVIVSIITNPRGLVEDHGYCY